MARTWSGFLPQNQLVKEEWDLLETCEAYARVVNLTISENGELQECTPRQSRPAATRTFKLRGNA